MPGHASAWCTGYPEICPSPRCRSPLNVANNETFDRINSLLEVIHATLNPNAPPTLAPGDGTPTNALPVQECTHLFPGGMMHLGGDEVNTGPCQCWVHKS